MGSRLRESAKQIFECFCEVASSTENQQPWILQKYPESYEDVEVLKSVPKFTYPCELENAVVQHFSFVLTSIDSKWTFGFCRHDPKTETALVVLSVLPWHETFYKLLNHIAALISSNNPKNFSKFLKDVYETNIPVSGSSVSIPIPDTQTVFVCQRPKQFQLPSIPENRNLTEYFSAIDTHNMMVVFASMLYERRIIFTSKRLSRLSACVQACNALIYPMIWQHIYIPVLPMPLIDYLLAPMPFLIGVPTPILKKVTKSDLGEVVILNADDNTIETPFDDLDSLPQDVVLNLKKALRNRAALLGDGVSRAFLRALVQLTAGYREALTLKQGQNDDHVRITFDQEAFVDSRPASMQPFLRKMLELQIFQQFIEERLNMLNSGLGFSDEFEMEACNYSDKSGSKFMQQYREWMYAMRKGSDFLRSVKNKANPAMKSAVKSVKDRGKDMKTAYKGLKWKGRMSRGNNGMRIQKPRSAPSSPTSDRRSFDSPSKLQSGLTPTTSYRKELRLRNSNVETSRKQYSPLSPSSPEESDSTPERLDIDLMQELRDVIFPNIPPVDRTLKPVRSLDSLRPAWSGRLRHGPLPKSNPYEPYELPKSKFDPNRPSADSNKKTDNKRALSEPEAASHFMKEQSKDEHLPTRFKSLSIPNQKEKSLVFDQSKNFVSTHQSGENSKNKLKNEDPFELYTNSNPAETPRDPFDTSRALNPFGIVNPLYQSFNPLNLSSSLNTDDSCSAPAKDDSKTQDLIRLDSTNSDDDFDPLLSKSSKSNNKSSNALNLSSLTTDIAEITEGLSNPLYPYFEPSFKQKDVINLIQDNPEKHKDKDLLQEYGLDFNRFNLSNGSSPSLEKPAFASIDHSLSEANYNNSSAFLTKNTVNPQKNWTKFE